LHSTLIAGQIALTLLLLATAGAAIQGFIKLNRTSLGYNPHNVMSVGIPVHDNSYITWEKRATYFDQLLQKVAAMPEVTMAGLSTNATPPDNGWDNKFEILGKPALEQQHARIYVPYTLYMRPWTQILVRSQVPPLSILHGVRQQIHSVDADQQAAGHVRSLEDWIKEQREWAGQHLMALLFGAFAFLALALAAVGLYSVVSYSVAQRTNEFGIRMALGATSSDLLRSVFASATLSVGSGLAAGVLLSLALNRLVSQWVEGSSIQASIVFGMTLLMASVAALACLVPARRASSVDPMKALRYE